MKAWAVFMKELKIFVRDRNALIQYFLVPILVITLANFAMQKMYGQKGKGSLVLPVVDLDQSATSRKLVETLQNSGYVRVEENQRTSAGMQVMTEVGLRRMIGETHQRAVGVLIPAGFETQLRNGAPAEVLLLENPLEKNGPDMAAAVLTAAVGKISQAKNPPSVRTQSATLTSTAVHVVWTEPDVHVRKESLINPRAGGMDSLKQNVPGFAIMFALFSLVWGSMSIVGERERGTFARLLSSPLGKVDILLGKLLIMFSIACMQLTVFFGFGHFVFGMDLGHSLLGLVLLSMTLALTATSLGVLLGSLAKTQTQLGAISSILILGMSALGGSWWPAEMMPDFMQTLAHFVTINAWAMDGYKNLLWYGGGFTSVLPQIGMLGGMAVVAFGIGVATFKFE